jgi:protein-L-isoaspartate(D-aspartate) O-methyltransferase
MINHARMHMVDSQLRPNGITDRRILDAFLAVDRTRFLPQALHEFAYSDAELSLHAARRLLSPMTLARLFQALNLQPDEHLLILGGTTGYSAALASTLGAQVTMLEADQDYYSQASENLVAETSTTPVCVILSHYNNGFSQNAPYNAILIEGRIEHLPDAIMTQLSPNGRLAAVLGSSFSAKLCRWEMQRGECIRQVMFEATAPALRGFEVAHPEFIF